MGIAIKSSPPQPWREEINEYQSVATDPLAKGYALQVASDFIQRVAPETSSELMGILASFKDARSGIFHKSKEVQGQRLIAVKKLVEAACLKISQNPPPNYENHENYENRVVIRAIYSLIRNDISKFNLLKLGKKKITDGFNCLLFQVQISATDKDKPSPFILRHATLAANFSKRLLSNLKKDHPEPQLLTALGLNLTKVVTQNIGAEPLILKAIYEQKFGIDSLIFATLAQSLASFKLSDLDAQYYLGKAIYEQKFGENPDTLKIVARSLASLKFTDAGAQYYLGKAIHEQKFGKNHDTLKIVASSLASLKFTDPTAQKWLGQAIAEQKFGSDSGTLKIVASSLVSLKFTGADAQKWLGKAIYEQKFGINPDTLEIVASSLASLNFTAPLAQYWLSAAIYGQKFGINPDTLKIVASSLTGLKFTGAYAQKCLGQAIAEQKFGSDSETLKIVASSLISLNFTNHDAHDWLSQAIQYKKFGADSEVMATVAKFLLQFSPSSVRAQDTILAEVLTARGALGHPLSIIANWVLSETRYNELKRKILDWTDKNSKQAEIQEFSGMGLRLTKHIQFGEFSDLNQVAERNITVEVANPPIFTVVNCHDCLSGHGSYGITYTEAGYLQFLIVYRDESHDNPTQIAERFRGFLYSDPEFSVLYQSNFAKLRVYDLTNLQDGYPRLVDSLSSGHLSFPAFPGWLQQAIIAQEFNPDDYVNSSIIKFVLSLVDDLPFAAEVLGQQCKAIVQSIIKNQGEAARLAAKPDEDAKIKDLIEEKMAAIDYSPSNSCHAKTREFVATLDNCTDKLKLGFLFGQIAKSGALGYHFSQSDSNNRANSLFAHLAIECFKQAIAEHPKELGPGHIIHTVLANIQEGTCIEAETHNLALGVPALSEVWQKKSAL